MLSSNEEMSDDLDNFFAKKISKKKKVGVQNVDDLGRRLERTVKKQEKQYHSDEDPQPKFREQEQLEPNRGNAGEDSEWLELDEKPGINPAELGIKELELKDHEDEVMEEDEKNPDAQKTWNLTQAQTPEVEEVVAPAVEAQEPPPEPQKSVYVPPSVRSKASGFHRTTATPNIQNDDEFPSLAAAMEVKEKPKKPKPTAYPGERSSSPDRRHQAGVEFSQPPKPGSYVPPHLRKSGGVMVETQNRFGTLDDEK